MAAKTFQEMRNGLMQQEKGATFASAFADGYFATAFGALSKSETDLLVFNALVAAGLIDPEGPVYTIARVLKITPAKAKNLLFQHQLRNADDAHLDTRVLRTLSEAKFSVDDKRLSFGVESPLTRAVIDARLKAAGIFSDISLSGEILRIPANQLGDFVRVFMDDEQARALRKKLKGANDDKGLVAALNSFGEAVAKDLAKDATKEVAKQGLKGLLDWIQDGGVGELADAVTGYFAQG